MRSHASQSRKAKKLSKEKKRSGGKRRTNKTTKEEMLQEVEQKGAEAEVEMETTAAETSSGIPVYSDTQNSASTVSLALQT